ncbi:MAG: hypothetical protein U0470_08035 [Anaerolineae bacterium]
MAPQARLLNSGLLSKQDVTALAAQMDPKPGPVRHRPRGEGHRYLRPARAFLEALGLVAWPDVHACRVDEATGGRFWSQPLDARAAAWFDAWKAASSGWHD